MRNYLNFRDYDAWKQGWHDASRERDPGEEVSHVCRAKSQNDWDLIQEAFVDLVKLIKTNPDEGQINNHIDWLAHELRVDAKLFNMGLL